MRFPFAFAFITSIIASTVVGCTAEITPSSSFDQEGTESTEEISSSSDELRVSFTKLAVTKSNSPAGLTLIRSASEYRSFFGDAPPRSVNFARDWVLHYSTGIQNTGGYGAEITSIDTKMSSPSGKGGHSLRVGTRETSPGPLCIVTQALTNPQMTVQFRKQPSFTKIQEIHSEVVTDCSVPNWCAAALCAAGTTCDESLDRCVGTKPSDCRVTGCGQGDYCTFCWTTYACIPNGAIC